MDMTSVLTKLVNGCVSEEMAKGREFFYENDSLLFDDVAELCLPAMAVFANDLSEKFLLQPLGCVVSLVNDRTGPLAVSWDAIDQLRDQPGAQQRMLSVEALMLEIFEVQVVSFGANLERLVEQACRRLGFTTTVGHEFMVGQTT